MEQQSRHQQARRDFRPINLPVEGVQLRAEVERPKNERSQAENIKVHGAGSVPAANKNEQADEEIQQTHDAKVILSGKRFFCGSRHQRRFKLFSVSQEFVVNRRPKPRAVQAPGDFCCTRDGGSVELQEDVPGVDGGMAGRRIGGNVPSLTAASVASASTTAPRLTRRFCFMTVNKLTCEYWNLEAS